MLSSSKVKTASISVTERSLLTGAAGRSSDDDLIVGGWLLLVVLVGVAARVGDDGGLGEERGWFHGSRVLLAVGRRKQRRVLFLSVGAARFGCLHHRTGHWRGRKEPKKIEKKKIFFKVKDFPQNFSNQIEKISNKCLLIEHKSSRMENSAEKRREAQSPTSQNIDSGSDASSLTSELQAAMSDIAGTCTSLLRILLGEKWKKTHTCALLRTTEN